MGPRDILKNNFTRWRAGKWESSIAFHVVGEPAFTACISDGKLTFNDGESPEALAGLVLSREMFDTIFVKYEPPWFYQHTVDYHNISELIKFQTVMQRPGIRADEPARMSFNIDTETNTPGLGVEYLEIGIEKQLERMRATLIPTIRCNALCAFCFGSFTPLEPSSTDISKAIEYIAATRIPRLLITGGEPTLFPSLIPLVNAFMKCGGWGACLQTNGLLLSKSLALKLKEAGADDCIISLHGVSRKTHENTMKAKNSFARTMQGIENSLEAGLNTAICYVIYEGNYQELPELPDMIFKHFGKKVCITLNFVGPVHREGIVDTNVIPSYSAVRPNLEDAQKNICQIGMPFYINNFLGAPMCVFPSLSKFRIPVTTTPISSMNGFSKMQFCQQCSVEKGCPGFPDDYLRSHNDVGTISPL